MSDWQASIKAAHERLKEWRRLGGIDTQTWALGMHVLASMHQLRTTLIRASVGYFSDSFLHHKGQVVVPWSCGSDTEYLRALQQMQGKIGIFSDITEDRLYAIMQESKENSMAAWQHISAVPSERGEKDRILPDTQLYFALGELDSAERLHALETRILAGYGHSIPAWMSR